MMRVTSTEQPPTTRPASPVPPPAVRLVRPGWRDPRLVVGVLLVCVSVLLGARLLSSGDDTVPVWATRGPVAQGAALSQDDLVVARVRFASESDAARYLAADTGLGQELVATRDLGEGELVPAEAVRADGDRLRELPLTLPAGAVPPAARPGSHVDVWAVPREGGAARADAAAGGRLLLEDVPVVAVGHGAVGGPEAMRQVVVGVTGSTDVGEVVDALGRGTALLVGRP
jgi:hypothetical protein